MESVTRDSVEWIAAVPAGGESARFRRRGARRKKRHLLDESGSLFYCFPELAARPLASHRTPGGRVRRRTGSRRSRFAAKRKRGQAIENKQSREMTDFVPPMISRTYDQAAKRFISPGAMKSTEAWRPLGRRSRGGVSAVGGGDDPKWRRKPLESLETDSKTPPPVHARERGYPAPAPLAELALKPAPGHQLSRG